MAGTLSTTAGDFPLEEVELAVDGKTWNLLHTGAVISKEQELEYLLGEGATKMPYGIVVWPSSIALAHELASRGAALAGKRILELGAGTGLPGIVAASMGAHVVQTDRQKLVLHVCEENSKRNGVSNIDPGGSAGRGSAAEGQRGSIEQRLADWTEWTDTERYDLIIGADILYSTPLHFHLKEIFATNLRPGGTLLLADPFRSTSMPMLHAMEAAGWTVKMDRWSIGEPPRPIGVFTMTAPAG